VSAEVAERYARVRAQTESLAAPLTAEDQTVQSMPDVSPTKWHRAHTTWFFETFILEPRGVRAGDASYRYLFNSYYEGVGPRHPRAERGLVTRPGVADVGAYRDRVDDAMGSLLEADIDDATAALVDLGLHHEQQHQELLLMDAKHVLSRQPGGAVYQANGPHLEQAASGGWVGSEGGVVEIGHAADAFAFDNESPRHAQLLRPFQLAGSLVTNRDWLAFVDDGGYRRPELWLSDGWHAVNADAWEAPLYWRRDGDGWEQFTLRGLVPLDLDEPACHVSYYEADAYARWAGARLPLEGEWEAMAGADLLADAFGQVWQWTSSAYLPYPGFRPAAGAVGEYNGKFMVNQHVLRGSCCYTPEGHERLTYRNFFPPGARWATAGVRLARDVE
jgi:ergothioneine biosynthesis protein EgtB